MSNEAQTHTLVGLIQLFGRQVTDQPRPVTRVDNMLLFPGGYCRTMTRRERLRMFLRRPLTVEMPTQAQQDFQRRFREYQDRVVFFGEGAVDPIMNPGPGTD